MAVADPQTVSISGTTTSLPRVGSDPGKFASADGNISYDFSHSYGKRTRRLVRINNLKIVADPLTPANNTYRSMSISIVADLPPVGYTAAEAKAVFDGFITQLQAASGAVLVKWFGGEQ